MEHRFFREILRTQYLCDLISESGETMPIHLVQDFFISCFLEKQYRNFEIFRGSATCLITCELQLRTPI